MIYSVEEADIPEGAKTIEVAPFGGTTAIFWQKDNRTGLKWGKFPEWGSAQVPCLAYAQVWENEEKASSYFNLVVEGIHVYIHNKVNLDNARC